MKISVVRITHVITNISEVSKNTEKKQHPPFIDEGLCCLEVENLCDQGSHSSFLQQVPKVMFSLPRLEGKGRGDFSSSPLPRHVFAVTINLLPKDCRGEKTSHCNKTKQKPQNYQEKGTILRQKERH